MKYIAKIFRFGDFTPLLKATRVREGLKNINNFGEIFCEGYHSLQIKVSFLFKEFAYSELKR